MKREEAIKLIDTHTVCFYNEIDSPTLQALHLAIEALSEDISEDGTLKVKVKDGSKVNRVLVLGDNNFGGLYYPDDRPQGEWKKKIEAMYGGSYCYFYMCSVCEEEQLADTNYCPNCGADMRGNK